MNESGAGAPGGSRPWRRIQPASLAIYCAKLHFEIGIVLISIVPFLTAIYAAGLGTWSSTSADRLYLTGLVLTGCLLAPTLGYSLLARYPRMVVRLRHHLTEIVRGEMPERLDLVRDTGDLAAIEDAMILILQKLKAEVNRVTDANAHVQGVQSFARQEADEVRNHIDLNEAIEHAVTSTRHEWKSVADLATFLDPDLPPVPCNFGEIRQAVATLIVNGAHAIAARGGGSQQAKGRIMITTLGVGSTVEIKVSDTGVGIPSALCDRIFEPVVTTREAGQGIGQGLALLHDSIVNRHGGRVTFDTTENQGTTFTVALPVDADRRD